MENKKTFKDLFANTGIEPTTDENGGVHYNFNATLKNQDGKPFVNTMPIIGANNSVKLYTEKQVEKAFESGFKLAMETDGGLKEGKEEFINSLTPMELPNNEEIEEEAFQIPFNNTNEFYDKSFIKGAKWMKEQILNQNK